MTILDQLPRFSAQDKGAVGEGTLDPLGLSPVAERIADLLAPGLRARMSQPRFTTLAAVGAMAQPEPGPVTASNGPAADIAFEWLVAEALARDKSANPPHTFPGSRKVARALRRNERVSASDYLASPRVFGFNGVYRPFARYAGVLDDRSDELGLKAIGLVEAWEQDQGLTGFARRLPGTEGNRFRIEASKHVRDAMEKGVVTAPATGQFLRNLAHVANPTGAGPRERAYLRNLLFHGRVGDGEIRNELVQLIANELAAGPGDMSISDRSLAETVAPKASTVTRRVLEAAIAYETCAAQMDYAFRSILRHGSSLHGAFTLDMAADAEGVAEIAADFPALVDAAHTAAGALQSPLWAVSPFEAFTEPLDPLQFAQALITHHHRVQANKAKLSWLDVDGDGWRVRRLFRDQPELDPTAWLHPMRLTTIAIFLKATA
ncbi:hypothetical protein [Gordonia alkaliphila]|uniref:Uncharacterized protein n=1 Tax=Gordonia alkaliphila TaxID=1053547 RepID=A0ABP8ZJI7_9ACTN